MALRCSARAAVKSQVPEIIFSRGSSIDMGWPIQAILPSLLMIKAVGIPSWPAAVIQVLAMAPSLAFLCREQIDGHSVGHLVSHLLDEWLDLGLVLLPDAHSDEGDVGLLLLKLGQMRNARLTWSAPRCPEFHDVVLTGLELADGFALDERLDVKLGSRVADAQRLWLRTGPLRRPPRTWQVRLILTQFFIAVLLRVRVSSDVLASPTERLRHPRSNRDSKPAARAEGQACANMIDLRLGLEALTRSIRRIKNSAPWLAALVQNTELSSSPNRLRRLSTAVDISLLGVRAETIKRRSPRALADADKAEATQVVDDRRRLRSR